MVDKQHVFKNTLINKSKLKDLMYNAFKNYGIVKSSIIADRLKNLTFHYATKSGISLSAEDLRVPYKKRQLIGLTNNEVERTIRKYDTGLITNVERFQKTIDIWNNANNFLKDEVVTYFRESDPLNPLYIMAFSGARGNISQVRQLVGMRGLMADPQGQIIDLPIRSNFREGLSVTEYIISSYGARKGLVDTALRTADSGYLTRRLVDVAQDIIVREYDCQTKDGIYLEELFNKDTVNLSFEERLIGRVLSTPLYIKGKWEYEITSEVLNELDLKNSFEKHKRLKVRSPLTCDSIRSVCRQCYGWHLAYSKLVDLGEAIGILAAQSIGEPGTQLTMRTFHTGGVFSGELTRQVRAPFKGTVHYSVPDSKAFLFRTIHGDMAFRLIKNLTLYITNSSGTRIRFDIPKDNVLLVNDKQKVYTNQIIAEIKKDGASVILEEEKKDIYTEQSGEVFFNDIFRKTNVDQKDIRAVNTKAGLIWVLQGTIYSLPRFTNFRTKVGTVLSKERVLTKGHLINKYSGVAKLDLHSKVRKINIRHYSVALKNTTVYQDDDQNFVLRIISKRKRHDFQLGDILNRVLKHGETLGTLKTDAYKTKTGGFVTYDLDKPQISKKRKNVKKIFSGFLYWVPEEIYNPSNLTHFFPSPKVKHGTFIQDGFEIGANVFSKAKGLAEVNELENEIKIKPGELYDINELDLPNFENYSRFVKPGEFIIPGKVIAQRLVYLEFLEIFGSKYLLVRPVKTYSIPREKPFLLQQDSIPENGTKCLRAKPVTRIFYRNWEKIEAQNGVDLLQTFLLLDLKNEINGLQPKFEIEESGSFMMKHRILGIRRWVARISAYEFINVENFMPKNLDKDLSMSVHPLVRDGQYVREGSILAQIDTTINRSGVIGAVYSTKDNYKEMLFLGNRDFKKIKIDVGLDKLKVSCGDLVRLGTYLTDNLQSPYSGQIYDIQEKQLIIRLGRPYLISDGTILQMDSGSLVKMNDTLATLVYEKLKTTDIVQGLPKVEEILEARKVENACILAPLPGYAFLRLNPNELPKNDDQYTIQIVGTLGKSVNIPINPGTKVNFANGEYVNITEPLTDGPISPHTKLELLFNYYRSVYQLNDYKAFKKSIKLIQLYLVNEVQKTYFSQGVSIADKHVEIIVRQMTSKVCIEESGSTTLLPGEIIDQKKAELIVKATFSNLETPPSYRPVLLGITKASLSSDSFISAASFQETTRVLTEAAIEGKKDWLTGLKENVIIGRLIPAGTGFNYRKNQEMIQREIFEIDVVFNKEMRNNLVNSRLTDPGLNSTKTIDEIFQEM